MHQLEAGRRQADGGCISMDETGLDISTEN
jgi:hypothetical protein